MRALHSARLGGTLVVLLAACSLSPSQSVSAPQVPSHIDYLAFVQLDADGRVIGSTGLVRRSQVIQIPELESATRVLWAVGYAAADLPEVVPSDAELVRIPVLIAGTDDPVLPAPSWLATGVSLNRRAELVVVNAATPFTASWLPQCPVLLPEPTTLVDLSPVCRTEYCGPAARQRGCTLEVDDGFCALGNIEARITGNGALRVTSSGVATECIQGSPSDGSLELICDRQCTLRIHPRGRERFRIAGEAALVEAGFSLDEVEVPRPVYGFISGVVQLGDDLVAVTNPDFYLDGRCDELLERTPSATSRIFRLDPATGAQREVLIGPPCLGAPAAISDGSGFFATFGRPEPWLGRFDAQGALTASVSLGLAPSELILRVLVHEKSERVSVMSRIANQHRTRLNVFDRRTLLRQFSLERPVEGGDLVELDADELGLYARSEDELIVFDAIRGVEKGGVVALVIGCRRNPLRAERMVNGIEENVLYLASTGSDAALFRVTTDGECTVARPYPEALDLTVALPLADGRVLVAGADREGDRAAFVGVVAPTPLRQLPGLTRVGHGPVTQILEVDGGFWLVLPWDGRLVRIEETPP